MNEYVPLVQIIFVRSREILDGVNTLYTDGGRASTVIAKALEALAVAFVAVIV